MFFLLFSYLIKEWDFCWKWSWLPTSIKMFIFIPPRKLVEMSLGRQWLLSLWMMCRLEEGGRGSGIGRQKEGGVETDHPQGSREEILNERAVELVSYKPTRFIYPTESTTHFSMSFISDCESVWAPIQHRVFSWSGSELARTMLVSS